MTQIQSSLTSWQGPKRFMLTNDSRKTYNEVVKKACKWRDEALMKEEMSNMKEKKMRTMFYQDLEMKEYVKNYTVSKRLKFESQASLNDNTNGCHTPSSS